MTARTPSDESASRAFDRELGSPQTGSQQHRGELAS